LGAVDTDPNIRHNFYTTPRDPVNNLQKLLGTDIDKVMKVNSCSRGECRGTDPAYNRLGHGIGNFISPDYKATRPEKFSDGAMSVKQRPLQNLNVKRGSHKFTPQRTNTIPKRDVYVVPRRDVYALPKQERQPLKKTMNIDELESNYNIRHPYKVCNPALESCSRFKQYHS
jgi:hypothetical protein